MNSIEVHKARAVVDELTGNAKPGPAIRALAMRIDSDRMTPFERYAASVLREAGALQLTTAGAPELRLQRTANGRLVRLTAPAGLFSAAAVRVLEDALNRLSGVVSALSEGIGSQLPASSESDRAHRRELFERHGIDYPLWSDTERGAHVRLPVLPHSAQPDDAYFNEIDWRLLDTVASNAHVFFQAAILANRNQVIFGVKAPHCSEWDVRTRLASVLESLEPALRITYRFDCDTSKGAAIVHFDAPPEESFPLLANDHTSDAREATLPASNQADSGHEATSLATTQTSSGREAINPPLCAARTAYTLRLAALVGAACFGAGRVIERAIVVGRETGGRPLVSCVFERLRFVYETLPTIDAGKLSTPELRFDPERVARALAAERAEYATRGGKPISTERLDDGRADPQADGRILPDDLQRLFHAKRVRDIDTSSYLGDKAAVIDAAKADSDDSLVATVAQLEGIALEMEDALAPPTDNPEARPLFCGNALSRAAIALLDDDLNVAAEAEAFLNVDDEPGAASLPDVYYFRAPDALFHAHVGLADAYRKLGDVRGAEAQADRCIALAPTTPAGFALKSDALAGQGRFKEAANVIMAGLRVAVAENDRALLLHDLAQLFWRMGRSREASALHIYTASLSGIYAEKSRAFVEQIADGASTSAFVRANLGEAAGVISAAGIPLVTERTRHALLAKAALGLTNARALSTASPYIAELAKLFPANRTIVDACNSIRFGIG